MHDIVKSVFDEAFAAGYECAMATCLGLSLLYHFLDTSWYILPAVMASVLVMNRAWRWWKSRRQAA